MLIEWHVPITMDDGLVLRADVYRPVEAGQYPVILTYGAYSKGLHFEDGYPYQWFEIVRDAKVLEHSTGNYLNWETPDPERFVPDGYAVVRVDSRGAGWSPGYLDMFSRRETLDFYECIEWAGVQPWSNGKVGLLGISYYAWTQWRVAELHPPHLAAIIPWEGLNDVYRDLNYHGGILSEFLKRWSPIQSTTVQYGVGDRAKKHRITGESVAGPETLSDKELATNRIDLWQEIKAHPFDDEFHRATSPDLTKVEVPLLSAANWGGQGIHPRGNFNGFVESSSKQKWLEVHSGSHWSPFYSDWAVELQKRFFDYFLKGADNGWELEPPVLLHIRRPGEPLELRKEHEWPLARTQWTKHFLSLPDLALTTSPIADDAATEYDAAGDGLTFSLPAADEELEVTGPLAAKLFVSADTVDTDLFLVLRLFDPAGDEVTFPGSTDPNTPIANGWLRASHRRLDPEKTLPHRPYHPHDRVEPLTPGEIYELDVEILPTCVVVPPGYRLALTVKGKDYEYSGEVEERAKTFHYATRGTGGMTHTDPDNRPPEVFAGRVTLHSGADHPSYVLLPIIPPA
jgi:hypothetical protein